MKKIRQEILQRIMFSKMLLQEATAGILNKYDQLELTKGVLLLHDAAEATLGAIADHLHATLSGNRYLLDYYKLIEEKDPSKKVPYRTQMRNLNTIRNSAKHQGIFPENKTVSHFPATVQALIEELCEMYLDVSFDSINLKSLIQNKTIKDYIEDAENNIKKDKYETALISLAYAIYYIVESTTISLLGSILGFNKEKDFEFTNPYGTDFSVKLLEHGVDPYLYHRFRNLTPKIGKETKTSKIVYHWDKYYGHPANWTLQNCKFCLWFATDTALKFQKERNLGYSLIPYHEAFEDVIEPLGHEAVFWNISKHNDQQSERKEIVRLKKGQSLLGYASDSDDKLDEWRVISQDIPSENKEYSGFGYVSKEEVNIRSQKRNLKKINK